MLGKLLVSNTGSGGELIIGYMDQLPLVDQTGRHVTKINTWTKDNIRRIMLCESVGDLNQSITPRTVRNVVAWFHENANNLDKL